MPSWQSFIDWLFSVPFLFVVLFFLSVAHLFLFSTIDLNLFPHGSALILVINISFFFLFYVVNNLRVSELLSFCSPLFV